MPVVGAVLLPFSAIAVAGSLDDFTLLYDLPADSADQISGVAILRTGGVFLIPKLSLMIAVQRYAAVFHRKLYGIKVHIIDGIINTFVGNRDRVCPSDRARINRKRQRDSHTVSSDIFFCGIVAPGKPIRTAQVVGVCLAAKNACIHYLYQGEDAFIIAHIQHHVDNARIIRQRNRNVYALSSLTLYVGHLNDRIACAQCRYADQRRQHCGT